MTARYVPRQEDRKMVRALAAYGVPQDDICKVLGISKPTLHKAFRNELDTAMIEANAKVAQSLFDNATKNMNVVAQIFWMKTRAKWVPEREDSDANVAIRVEGGLPEPGDAK